MLASIAHKFVVGDELPKVPYRTLLDYFVDTCFYLQFLAALSIFLVYYFEIFDVTVERRSLSEAVASSGSGESADLTGPVWWKLNWCLLGFNVLLFLIMCVWVGLRTWFVFHDVEHWRKMADYINSGNADSVTDSMHDIHSATRPEKHWFADYLHTKRSQVSKFLHIGQTHEKASLSTSMKARPPQKAVAKKPVAKNLEVQGNDDRILAES